MARGNFTSIVIAAAVGGMAFWSFDHLGLATDLAGALAALPTILTHFRWQQKGLTSMWLPGAAFLLCLLALVVVQLAAARYTSSLLEPSLYLLYPSLAMCFTICFASPLLLLLGRKPQQPALEAEA